MAAVLRADQERQTTQVNRRDLINHLMSNRDKHVRDYEEAMAGYKTALLARINEAFSNAEKKLREKYEALQGKIAALTYKDIEAQNDFITLIEHVSVEMRVPRSYAEEYDLAISKATWDTRDTVELTHAEFLCLIRDKWDWRKSFDEISAMYKHKQ
jgi:hypothetical protein